MVDNNIYGEDLEKKDFNIKLPIDIIPFLNFIDIIELKNNSEFISMRRYLSKFRRWYEIDMQNLLYELEKCEFF